MKNLSIILLGLSGFLVCLPMKGWAQIPPASDPHCAYCNVNLKTGEAHKKGCKYYTEPKEEASPTNNSSSSTSSGAASTNPDGINPKMPFKDGRCPQCGKSVPGGSYINSENSHSGCLLGEAIWKYWHYQELWSKAKKKKDETEAWSKMKDAEAEILRVAEEALKKGNPR